MPWEYSSGSSAPAPSAAGDGAIAGLPAWAFYPPFRAAVEYLAALVLFLLSAPVMMVAAALVRLTSSGQPFYSQVRVGRDGQLFTIYKIRSMYENCERFSGPCWAVKGDSRITPVGRLLRATHIDELPQLINVLKGEMSLIGPRPERPEHVQALKQEIPRYCERLRVRPGVTGFAQVQLPPDTDVESVRLKVSYDLYYIDAMNPWLDLRIILCTALKMSGIPFSVLRRLFAMPSGAEVEEYHRAAESQALPQPA